MKKVKALMLVVLLLVVIVPFTAKADDVRYKRFFIKATIEQNTDLNVQEYFYLTGKYNGAFRDIYFRNSEAYPFNENTQSYGGSDLHNAKGLYLQSIKAYPQISNFDFNNIGVSYKEFKQVESASNGDSYKYIKSNDIDGSRFKMYLPSKKKEAFYLDYSFSKMAIIHNDVGEIGWNIFNDSFEDHIDYLEVTLIIPNNKNELRCWYHSDSDGELSIVSKTEVKLVMNNLYSYTPVDIRCVFDKDVLEYNGSNEDINSILNTGKKYSNVDALDKILKYESSDEEKDKYNEEHMDSLTEKQIRSYLDDEKEFDRFDYDSVKGYIESLHTQELKDKYMAELISKQSLCDKNEIEIIEMYLNDNIRYYDYEEAKKHVGYLFDQQEKDKYNKILDDVYNDLKQKEIRLIRINIIVFVLSILLLIIIYYIFYIYRSKKYIKSFDMPYLRDFPSDLTPIEVNYLNNLHAGKTFISAGILELIRKKIITYEVSPKLKDYVLRKNPKSKKISELEGKFLDMLFGSNDKIVLNKKFSISNKKYEKMVSYIKEELIENGYIIDDKNSIFTRIREYFKGKKKAVIGIIIVSLFSIMWFPLLILLLPVIIFILYPKRENILYSYIAIANFGLLVYVVEMCHIYPYAWLLNLIVILIAVIFMCINKAKTYSILTDKGRQEMEKWNALKKFMLDFSSMDEKELPEVVLWEKYLVYATALGIGKKVSKVLKLKIEQENIDFDDFWRYTSVGIKTFNCRVDRPVSSFSGSYGDSFGGSSGGGYSGGSSGGSFGGGSGGGHF